MKAENSGNFNSRILFFLRRGELPGCTELHSHTCNFYQRKENNLPLLEKKNSLKAESCYLYDGENCTELHSHSTGLNGKDPHLRFSKRNNKNNLLDKENISVENVK